MSYRYTKASYDLLLEIFHFTKEFKREYKYTVGESLKKEMLEMITYIYQANSKRDKQETLQLAREKIEVIRLFVRMMKDLHEISLKRFVQVNKQIEPELRLAHSLSVRLGRNEK